MSIMVKKKLHIKIFELMYVDVKKIIQSLVASGISLGCIGGCTCFLSLYLRCAMIDLQKLSLVQ